MRGRIGRNGDRDASDAARVRRRTVERLRARRTLPAVTRGTASARRLVDTELIRSARRGATRPARTGLVSALGARASGAAGATVHKGGGARNAGSVDTLLVGAATALAGRQAQRGILGATTQARVGRRGRLRTNRAALESRAVGAARARPGADTANAAKAFATCRVGRARGHPVRLAPGIDAARAASREHDEREEHCESFKFPVHQRSPLAHAVPRRTSRDNRRR